MEYGALFQSASHFPTVLDLRPCARGVEAESTRIEAPTTETSLSCELAPDTNTLAILSRVDAAILLKLPSQHAWGPMWIAVGLAVAVAGFATNIPGARAARDVEYSTEIELDE